MTTENHTAFAHTPTGAAPPYLNISRQNGLFTVTVRSADGRVASIELSPEMTEAMCIALCADLYRKDLVV